MNSSVIKPSSRNASCGVKFIISEACFTSRLIPSVPCKRYSVEGVVFFNCGFKNYMGNKRQYRVLGTFLTSF